MTIRTKPSAELVLECDDPAALKGKVIRFLCIANMPCGTIERTREVAIDVLGLDHATIARLHQAMLAVTFAKTCNGIILRRHE